MSGQRAPGRGPSRRRLLWLGLGVLFVAMPLLEIAAIIQVGQVIGGWWTLALLVIDSVIGAWLVRREGGRAWKALNEALRSGRMPAGELADGALILIGGTLLLTPGFITDALGVLLVLPLTRPVARRLVTQVITRRLVVLGPTGLPGQGFHPGPGTDDSVIRGEVVDD